MSQKTLAIDTAGPVIGVALRIGTQSWVETERVQRGAEARLVPWALELCRRGRISLSGLDGVVVANGPGAFTGIRVGLATSMGLAMSAGLPAYGVLSLTPRAIRAGGGLVLSLLDARKGRVYAALYQDGRLVEGPADIEPGEAVKWVVGRHFLATGEGACVYRALIEAAGGKLALEPDHPSVDVLAEIGAAAFARGEGVDPVGLRPVYLREPDAQKRSHP